MRLNTDAYFENLNEVELFERLRSLGKLNMNRNINYMKETLKEYERSRHFIVWHVASVIANHGHILFNVQVLYDPTVFYTSEEYKKLTGYDVKGNWSSWTIYHR